MVALGLYGVAKLVWTVFAPSSVILQVVHTLLLGMGAASAVLGGVMALIQRHVKRLLAFSTISHTGIMLIGLALLNTEGLSGMLVYLVGHGLVKGALFMVAGILLALCGGIDEIRLRGSGRDIWPAGTAMALGGLLLAGLPLGLLDKATELIDAAAYRAHANWTLVAVVAGAACTGGAVLRVTGRIFLGLGQVPGEEEQSPTEEEQEKADRPLWLMLAPAILMLMLVLPGADVAGEFAVRAARSFMRPDTVAVLGVGLDPVLSLAVEPPPLGRPVSWLPWVSVPLALAIAAVSLAWRNLPGLMVSGFDWVFGPISHLLSMIHSGLIGDYVAWMMVGLALFVLAFAFS